MNHFSLDDYLKQAEKDYPKNRDLIKHLKKKKPKDLDKVFYRFHNYVFEHEIDCLQCANCCRSLGPGITDNDVQRISKALKSKPSVVYESYFNVDEDNDIVFKEMPCPFLLDDNYCMIYDSRPKACKEYPHSDRKRMNQILSICLKNTLICPAMFLIFRKLREIY